MQSYATGYRAALITNPWGKDLPSLADLADFEVHDDTPTFRIWQAIADQLRGTE